MKPLFTVHAGEFLVASYIEQRFKDYLVWIPSRDSVAKQVRSVTVDDYVWFAALENWSWKSFSPRGAVFIKIRTNPVNYSAKCKSSESGLKSKRAAKA
jgi:hypothetical protein